LLFDVISTAYERTSLIVTTNLPFENWTEVLGSERLTGATLDRLTHRCHILEATGESYRLQDAVAVSGGTRNDAKFLEKNGKPTHTHSGGCCCGRARPLEEVSRAAKPHKTNHPGGLQYTNYFGRWLFQPPRRWLFGPPFTSRSSDWNCWPGCGHWFVARQGRSQPCWRLAT